MEEQNIKKEAIGVGEKIQYLAHTLNDNTVRCELRYPARLSAALMEKAVLAVVRGIDVLHASFVTNGNSAYWQINTDVSGKDCFCVFETDDEPMLLADQAILHPILPEGRTQMFCTLILGNQESALALTVSHLCVDGGDAKYLLEKVMQAYNLVARNGSAEGLILKNGSRSAFQVYEDLGKREFLAAFKSTDPGEKTSFPFPDEEAGAPHLVKYTLDAELIQKLRQYGKARGVTLNDLLLTAFYRAYIDLPGAQVENAVAIMSMMDLRRHRKDGQSEGLCNMSGALPTVLRDHIHGSFEETLMEIAAQTRAAKEDELAGLHGMPKIHLSMKLLPLGFLMKQMEKAGQSMSIGLTNLGNIPCDKLALEGVRPTEGAFGGPLKKKPGMQIAASGFNGQVTLLTVGEYTDRDAALIHALMEDIAARLRAV